MAIVVLASLGLGVSGGFAAVTRVVSAIGESVPLGHNTPSAAIVVYCQPPGVVFHGWGVTSTGCQSTGGDQHGAPGAPSVSGVTVVVAGSGQGPHGTKPAVGFTVSRLSLRPHGVIVVTVSSQTRGKFAARVGFTAVGIRPGQKRLHLHGTYGSGSATLTGRGSVNLVIAPGRSAARALATGARLTISIGITFTPVVGTVQTRTVTLTVFERRGGQTKKV